MNSQALADWYVGSFGARYSQLYAHRSASEAEAALSAVAPDGGWAGRRVLDVACGAGRHLRALAARGATALGLDLSPVLLAEARLARPEGALVRADMRHLPFAGNAFDDLLSMFTSFGYFEDEEAHRRLARECARVARHRIVVDLPNPRQLEASLVPESERSVGDLRVHERRWIERDPLRVCKDIRLMDERTGAVEEYAERVMLFAADQLAAWLGPEGFALRRCFGDYDGCEFERERSPRQLCVFEREDA